LADLRLHLECCAASTWPASPALLLFFLLMVTTVLPQVRPILRSALPFFVNAIFATGHQEYWVYHQLVNMYVLCRFTNVHEGL
jgi:hypothetical protein